MIDVRVDAVAYSSGEPVTFVATATYTQSDERDLKRIEGAKANTKEDALRNLIAECRAMHRLTSELIEMYNFIRTDNNGI